MLSRVDYDVSQCIVLVKCYTKSSTDLPDYSGKNELGSMDWIIS